MPRAGSKAAATSTLPELRPEGQWRPPGRWPRMDPSWELTPDEQIVRWQGVVPPPVPTLAPIPLLTPDVRESPDSPTHPLPTGAKTGRKRKVPQTFFRVHARRLFERIVRHPTYMKTLTARMHDGSIHPSIEAFILGYVFGKPSETPKTDPADRADLPQIVHEYVTTDPSHE